MIDDFSVERNDLTIPSEVIICSIIIWYLCSIVTIGQNTLQLRRQYRVVLVPEAGGGYSLARWAGVFCLLYQVSSVLASPAEDHLD